MLFDAVLKVGGSLSRSERLSDLCREIGQLGKRRRVLIVPGGGGFADQVRLAYRRFNLGETVAHRMALLAMEQYAWLLSELTPHSVAVPDLLAARRIAEGGHAPILLPASLLTQADPLPHSWQVTSDAIAAWTARIAACRMLVLLKDVDGLYSDWPQAQDAACIPELSADELAAHHGGVDEYLAKVLPAAPFETWVINGQHPGRLTELLDRGQTQGTRIPARR